MFCFRQVLSLYFILHKKKISGISYNPNANFYTSPPKLWPHQYMMNQSSCSSPLKQLLRPSGHESSSESQAAHMQSELQPDHTKRRTIHGVFNIMTSLNCEHSSPPLSICLIYTHIYILYISIYIYIYIYLSLSIYIYNIYIIISAPKAPQKLPSQWLNFQRAIRACPHMSWVVSSSVVSDQDGGQLCNFLGYYLKILGG